MFLERHPLPPAVCTSRLSAARTANLAKKKGSSTVCTNNSCQALALWTKRVVYLTVERMPLLMMARKPVRNTPISAQQGGISSQQWERRLFSPKVNASARGYVGNPEKVHTNQRIVMGRLSAHSNGLNQKHTQSAHSIGASISAQPTCASSVCPYKKNAPAYN